MDPSQYQVIVVGGGAAGLLAAARAAERGRRVLLLEKNRRPGVKILMSGGTRCNITHDADVGDIEQAFGDQGRFLRPALYALPPDEVVRLVNDEGVATKIEPGGKIFPESDRAADVLAAFEQRLRRSGAKLAAGEPLESVSLSDQQFELITAWRKLRCDKLILTTGGKSYPRCGTAGDGYAWAVSAWRGRAVMARQAAELGHTIVPPRPALTPIVCPARWVHQLRGVAVRPARVSVIDPEREGKRRRLDSRQGDLLFTHFGLSGPAALDVSRVIARHERPASLKVLLDLAPGLSREAFERELLAAANSAGAKSIGNLLGDWLPRRLIGTLLEQAGVDAARRAAELDRRSRQAVVSIVKELPLAVSGTMGFKKAEVTAGGVALKEIDPATMESRITPGLYLAGEILDIDGPIGGYNFQAAFSTGWLAGESV